MARTASPNRPVGESIEQSIERKLLVNEPLSEAEVAALFGCSRARINALEKRALRKLRAAMAESEASWLEEFGE